MHRAANAFFVGAAFAALAAGCTAVETHRGYVPDAEILSSIVVGTDTKDTVSQKLGTPTTRGTFSNDVWYYISSRDIQTAFFAPQSIERNIVEVQFSENGQVAGIRHYGLEDGRVVDYVDRETTAFGSETSLIQLLFNAVPGNIGMPSRTNAPTPGGGQGPPPLPGGR